MEKQPAWAAAINSSGLVSLPLFEAGVKGIRGLLKDAGLGGKRALAGFEIAFPNGICGAFHSHLIGPGRRLRRYGASR